MDCKTTSTKAVVRRRQCGATLSDTLMAMGVSGLLLGVLASLTMYCGKSLLAMLNYADLNDKNRIAVDTMTRDLRECNRVISCTSTQLDIEDSSGGTISYVYSPGAGTLNRQFGGFNRTLATGCETLAFSLGTRNPIGGTFGVVSTTDVSLAKVVNVRWNCSRTILGSKQNTESVQTARIVIRKQG